jgi:hypothetical protein
MGEAAAGADASERQPPAPPASSSYFFGATIVKLTVTAGGVPVGSYLGKFMGVEPVSNDYGTGLCWKWEIAGGTHTGQKISRITAATPSPKNAGGKILAGLIGKALTPGEQVDLADLVGRVYLLVVTEGERGGTRVESVTTAPVG